MKHRATNLTVEIQCSNFDGIAHPRPLAKPYFAVGVAPATLNNKTRPCQYYMLSPTPLHSSSFSKHHNHNHSNSHKYYNRKWLSRPRIRHWHDETSSGTPNVKSRSKKSPLSTSSTTSANTRHRRAHHPVYPINVIARQRHCAMLPLISPSIHKMNVQSPNIRESPTSHKRSFPRRLVMYLNRKLFHSS